MRMFSYGKERFLIWLKNKIEIGTMLESSQKRVRQLEREIRGHGKNSEKKYNSIIQIKC